jgi:hypothetical protein
VVCCHLKPRSIIFLLKANIDRPEEPWNTHPTVSRERDSRFDSLCEEREGGRGGERESGRESGEDVGYVNDDEVTI